MECGSTHTECNPEICEGCSGVITDHFVLKVASRTMQSHFYSWHERCLKCCMCGHRLEEKCFERDGRLYCWADYNRLFGHRCSTCHGTIGYADMVLKTVTGQFYHSSCFQCNICYHRLQAGEKYALNTASGQLFCEHHGGDSQSISRSPASSNSLYMKPGLCSAPNTSSFGSTSWSEEDADGLKSPTEKSDKRPRTVLSAAQRRVLKNAFDLDPKPSKKARHVMAVETNLTNRVVQVWFQNQRAKMKKRTRVGGSSEKYSQEDEEPPSPDVQQTHGNMSYYTNSKKNSENEATVNDCGYEGDLAEEDDVEQACSSDSDYGSGKGSGTVPILPLNDESLYSYCLSIS